MMKKKYDKKGRKKQMRIKKMSVFGKKKKRKLKKCYNIFIEKNNI